MTVAGPSVTFLVFIPWLWFMFCIIPLFSVTVRRLHDTGHRWFWAFVPVASFILMFLPSSEKSVSEEAPNNNSKPTEWGAILLTVLLLIIAVCVGLAVIEKDKTQAPQQMDASSFNSALMSDKIEYVSTIIESTLDKAEAEGMGGVELEGGTNSITGFYYDGNSDKAIAWLSNGKTESKKFSSIIPLAGIYKAINESPEYITSLVRGSSLVIYEEIGIYDENYTVENYVITLEEKDSDYVVTIGVKEGTKDMILFGMYIYNAGESRTAYYDIGYGGVK